MKFTRSKDGKPRATIRLTIRVSQDDMVTALATLAARDGLDDLPERPSAAWIWRMVREVYLMDGTESPGYWRDDITDEDADAIEEWATAAVERRFPQL